MRDFMGPTPEKKGRSAEVIKVGFGQGIVKQKRDEASFASGT
jgi:hypothetical protein